MSPAKPPVVLVSRRLAYGNQVWNVHLDHIRSADGKVEVLDYLTVAPKVPRPDLISGVAILPVIGEQILMLRSWRHAVSSYVWELPRGFIDEGEDPATAALRELEEETGLVCTPTDLKPLGTFLPEPSTITGRSVLYVALSCRESGQRLHDEIGLGEAHRFSHRDALGMLDRSEIEDASAVIALQRWRVLFQNAVG